MSEIQANRSSRRGFLAGLVRGAAIGAIAIVSAALIKRRRGPRPGQRCVSDGFCRDCRALDNCKLPQALIIKRGAVKK